MVRHWNNGDSVFQPDDGLEPSRRLHHFFDDIVKFAWNDPEARMYDIVCGKGVTGEDYNAILRQAEWEYLEKIYKNLQLSPTEPDPYKVYFEYEPLEDAYL